MKTKTSFIFLYFRHCQHQRTEAAHFLLSFVCFVYSSPRCAHISPSPVDRLELFTQLSRPPSFVGRRVDEGGWQPAAVLITLRNNFLPPMGASSSFSFLCLWQKNVYDGLISTEADFSHKANTQGDSWEHENFARNYAIVFLAGNCEKSSYSCRFLQKWELMQ